MNRLVDINSLRRYYPYPQLVQIFANKWLNLTALMKGLRGIAQSGSAPALGAGCRGFESLYPDQIFVFIFKLLILRIKII